jgi:hypothetical protein
VNDTLTLHDVPLRCRCGHAVRVFSTGTRSFPWARHHVVAGRVFSEVGCTQSAELSGDEAALTEQRSCAALDVDRVYELTGECDECQLTVRGRLFVRRGWVVS